MKLLSLLFITVILSSCGMRDLSDLIHKREEDPRRFDKTNPIFDEFVINFKNHYEDIHRKSIRTSHIPINFGNHSGNVLGICYSWSGGKREIIIDKEKWDNMNYCEKDVLIAHELGHCTGLDRGHNNKTVNGQKVSIMHEYILKGSTYCKYEDAYHEELHTGDDSWISNIFN